MNLADPELELIDPTPNVHALFLQFDKTFFDTKLACRAVVRWSKRMYSCAGVCSYEGRGGLCDIALSEPLLKLRPRKDLIETLLHEMIHAFLFVTNRDQDRDGHGPQFQAHMHRINKSAGLNISIYHDFHDEVKLYQLHWWRCNGRCVNKKPYFGIVRRSSNRAPGPNDFWWQNHQRSCGGTFIKIKEPEKKQKKSTKSKGDITKFINNNNKTANKNTSISSEIPKSILKPSNSIPKKPYVSIKSNGSSTVTQKTENPIPVPFSGKGQSLNSSKIPSIADVAETVRSIWANKQLDSSLITKPNINSKKHKAVPHLNSPPAKIKKIDDYFKTTASNILKDIYGTGIKITQPDDSDKLIVIGFENLVDCPICNRKISNAEINKHVDECLNTDVIAELSKDNKLRVTVPPLTSSQQKVVNVEIDLLHQSPDDRGIDCNETNETDITISNITMDLTHVNYETKSIVHVKTNSNSRKTESDSSLDTFDHTEPGKSKDIVLKIGGQICACCGIKVDVPMEEHLDECLTFFDNNATIPEEGASTSFVNETIVIDDDDDDVFDETQTHNETGTKFPCPCCFEMIEQNDMNEHLDGCLA